MSPRAWVPAAGLGLLVVLAGCGDDAHTPTTPPATPTTGTTTTAVPPGPVPSAGPTGSPVTVETIPPAEAATTAPVRGGAPDPEQVDRGDADAVGLAFVQLAWTSDTRTDTTPTDAGRRAAALADDDLGAALREATTAAAPGAQWQQWVERDAFTRVEATENMDAGRPRDGAEQVVRSWTLTVQPVADDGWQGTAQTLTVYVSLTRSPGGQWVVDDLRSQA